MERKQVNVVIFSRVSSTGDRQNTDRQTNELKEYAKRLGYNLVGIYEEKISGFKKNEDRPVLNQLLNDIDNGIDGHIQIDKVLTSELSRISRSVLQGLSVIQTFIDRKVSLYIQNYNLETLNPDKSVNPMTMFMVQILASVATMEAETTKVRFQSGYRNYLANGGKVGRKKGQVVSDEDFLSNHKDVVKLLKRNLSIRQISGLTEKKSLTTIMKVKKTALKLGILTT
ncbi:recombinase family protein [Aquirufa antheringensis]|uniref:recombinase family protein n=1 Tax=Aquirufa antheringensis TaxID=2516559 RepID=UPI00208ECA5B|nr:recombinase family protein [Aquirufa antheringensis]USQ03504.1 recombinase family protein [Aquirufa antheringensis]